MVDGWELVCVQETPEHTKPVGNRKLKIKLIMFFQWKIIGRPNVAPPSYSKLSMIVTTKPITELDHSTAKLIFSIKKKKFLKVLSNKINLIFTS